MSELVLYPAPVLRGRAGRFEGDAKALRALVRDMWDTMHAHRGMGLAAPQIGVDLQVAVVKVDDVEVVLVNPRLTRRSGSTVGQEGCLSCPGDHRWVTRFARVTVEYTDEHGDMQVLDADGMLAVAVQHEFDHLQGTLIIDHMAPNAQD